jgi:hypothetical protein
MKIIIFIILFTIILNKLEFKELSLDDVEIIDGKNKL